MTSMLRAMTLRPVASLLLGVGLLTVGNALLGTVVSLRMSIEGFPRFASGLVMSAYFGGFMLGSFFASGLIDRVGYIRAFAAFAAVFGAAASAQALIVAPVPWVLLRGIVGFAVAGELIVAESWLNASASGNRGRVFSLYMVVVYLAFGAGQFALALGNPGRADLFLGVTLVLSASIVPIVLSRAEAPTIVPASRLPLGRIARRAPLGLAGAFAAGASVGAVQSIGPQYANEMGLSVRQVSVFMGTFFSSGLLLQWPAGLLSDRTDRRRVLGMLAFAAAVAFVAIATLERLHAPLVVLSAIGGAVAATIYPLSVAHAHDRLHDEHVVSVTAGLLLANGLGAIAGPLLAVATMHAVGAPGLFYFAAAPCLCLSVYAAARVARHAPVAQDRFEPVAQTTPIVLELDPRARREAGGGRR